MRVHGAHIEAPRHPLTSKLSLSTWARACACRVQTADGRIRAGESGSNAAADPESVVRYRAWSRIREERP
jgi:hypothetical protein